MRSAFSLQMLSFFLLLKKGVKIQNEMLIND